MHSNLDVDSIRSCDSFKYFQVLQDPNFQCAHDSNYNVDSHIQFTIADKLNGSSEQYQNKELLCPDFARRPLSDVDVCNFDATMPKAVYTRKLLPGTQLANIVHAFTSVSDKFGRNGKLEDVFKLFNRFKNEKNVIFSDEADRLVTTSTGLIDEDLYDRIQCNNVS